jgi:Domain of unknown function (DUF4129)
VTERVPKEPVTAPRTGFIPGELVAALIQIFWISAVVILVGLVSWIVWKYRHVFLLRGGRVLEMPSLPAARVVLGMAVSPESLPPDVPTVAWALWQQGQHQEALGLLYRGSISRVIELARVEIHESDTEGDCVRRVEQIGAVAHPDYFREITGLWIRLAYAGTDPQDTEVQRVCQRWPFGERRAR